MGPIQLLKQSIGQHVMFNGEFAQLGSFRDVLYVGAENPWITLEVGFKPSKKVSKSIVPLLRHQLISKKFSKLNELEYKISFDERQIRQSFLVNKKRIFTVSFLEVEHEAYRCIIEFPKPLEQASCRDCTMILSPEALAIAPSGRESIPRSDIESFSRILYVICNIIRKEIESTYHISALRELVIEAAEDSYFPTWVGRNGQRTVGLLALIFGPQSLRLL